MTSSPPQDYPLSVILNPDVKDDRLETSMVWVIGAFVSLVETGPYNRGQVSMAVTSEIKEKRLVFGNVVDLGSF